jgi:hypothetical protein
MGHALFVGMGEVVMSSIPMYNNSSTGLLIDDRNERPLLIAFVAIAAAWSIVFLLAL